MHIQTRCRQRRPVKPDLLENPLVHSPRTVKEMNLGIRLSGLDLFGHRKQWIDMPACAATRKKI